MKDVPSVLPDGLEIVCVPEREDPRDAWISQDGTSFEKLKQGGRIGTSSLRRQAQLLHQRTDVDIQMLRGNLDTRLKKLQQGNYDAIVLAAAGLRRLGWGQEISEYLSTDVSLPAIGQGALGLEGRSDDTFLKDLIVKLEDRATRATVNAERAFLIRLEGGCQVPIAGHAVMTHNQLSLDGLIASVDGKRYIRQSITGSVDDAEKLGVDLAERLLSAGGKPILQEIYGTV